MLAIAASIIMDAAMFKGLDWLQPLVSASGGGDLALHLFRRNEPMKKVFKIVGMDRAVGVATTLRKRLQLSNRNYCAESSVECSQAMT